MIASLFMVTLCVVAIVFTPHIIGTTRRLFSPRSIRLHSDAELPAHSAEMMREFYLIDRERRTGAAKARKAATVNACRSFSPAYRNVAIKRASRI